MEGAFVFQLEEAIERLGIPRIKGMTCYPPVAGGLMSSSICSVGFKRLYVHKH